MRRIKIVLLWVMAGLITTGCEGVFDWVYDAPADEDVTTPVEGQFYFDFSDWKKWYYLDLPTAVEAVKADSTHNIADDFVEYDIPVNAIGDVEEERGGHKRSGQYMYYFDVFGEGITKNHFTSFTPTEPQAEPEKWTIAIHRNNVRTNGCSAYETSLTDIDAVTLEMCKAVTEWKEDEWTENVVWDDQSTMISCYVPSQGIPVNMTISSWLTMKIPPVPPSFSMNNHVMLIRLADGSFGALQLVDYVSPTNKKCCLTVKYKYPI